MSRYVTFVWVALFLVVPVAQAASPDTPPNKAKLQEVIDAWASMDVSRAAQFYAKDAGLVFYDVAPRAYTGWSQYEVGTREMFKNVKSLNMKIVGDPQIHRTGATAWTTALVDGELVMNDGSRLPVNARLTTVWEKRANKWLIVHDHFSMPLPEPPPSNAATMRSLYDAFGRGDIPTVLAGFDPNIEWMEAENFAYADRNPYRGPQGVAEGIFARIPKDWDNFRVNVDNILDAGDHVVAQGHYTATNKATGQPLNAQFVHVWTLKNGKVVHFQQYTDTAQFGRVMTSAPTK